MVVLHLRRRVDIGVGSMAIRVMRLVGFFPSFSSWEWWPSPALLIKAVQHTMVMTGMHLDWYPAWNLAVRYPTIAFSVCEAVALCA